MNTLEFKQALRNGPYAWPAQSTFTLQNTTVKSLRSTNSEHKHGQQD